MIANRKVTGFAWNTDAQQPLLAVALQGVRSAHRTEGGSVLLFRGDGDHFEDVVIRTRDAAASPLKLAWAPAHVHNGGLLAVGWDDGTLLVWSLKDRLSGEEQEQHAPHAVTLIEWSPEAERFISGDGRQPEAGPANLSVWKARVVEAPQAHLARV